MMFGQRPSGWKNGSWKAVLVTAFLHILPSGCTDELADQTGESVQPIVNGQLTTDFPAVGALLHSNTGNFDAAGTACTGSLIGCSTFLTAAHCFWNENEGFHDEDVNHYAVFFQNGGHFEVASLEFAKDEQGVKIWDGGRTTDSGDLAILRLARPVVGIQPLATNSLASPPAGTSGENIGFGSTSSTSDSGGVKRRGMVVTTACSNRDDTEHICWGFDGQDSDTCFGDSGGPMLADLGLGPMIVGVTHGGNNQCVPGPGESTDTDVFKYREFIRQQLAGDDPSACGTANVTWSSLTGWTGKDVRLSIDVPPGTKELRVGLNTQGTLDLDLYVKKGGWFFASSADCKTTSRLAFCSLPVTPSARHTRFSVLLKHRGGTQNYQLSESFLPDALCDDQDQCTQDAFDSTRHSCIHTVVEGLSCDDGIACSAGDSCRADGRCLGMPFCEELRAEAIASTSGDGFVRAALQKVYTKPVVVCTPVSDTGSIPILTRVQNAGPTGFDFAVIEASEAQPFIRGVAVHCLVVEQGVYSLDEHGAKLEAKRLALSEFDRDATGVGRTRTYGQTYNQPVVVGQVMTADDPRWSVFWARGGSRQLPPSKSSFWAGYHTGEDNVSARSRETVGYIVFEAGRSLVGDLDILTRVGPETVRGTGTSVPPPPTVYSISDVRGAFGAVLSMAGMRGDDGGWPILFGSRPVARNALSLAIEEDIVLDAERNHTTERVAYAVYAQRCDDGNACTRDTFAGSGCQYYPISCDDGLFCNGAETCDPGLGCQPGTPVECSGPVQTCHEIVCDEALQSCVDVPAAAGGSCDDGDVCTSRDACDGSGQCGGMPSQNCGGPALGENVRLTLDSAPSVSPAIATNSTGGSLVVWQDHRDGNAEIYLAGLDSAGRKIGSDTRLTSSAASSIDPDVAVDTAGNAYVAWQEGSEIRVGKFDSSGLQQWIHTLDANQVSNAAIAVSDNGATTVVWEKTVTTFFRIYMAQFDTNGVQIGSNILVSNRDIIHFTPKRPSVSLESSGRAWFSWRDYGGFFENGIYAAVYETDQTASLNRNVFNNTNAQNPSISIGTSNFYLLFEQSGNVKSWIGVNDATQLNQVSGQASFPSVATDPSDDTACAAWQDARNGQAEIYLTCIQPDGTNDGNRRLTNASGGSRAPDVASNRTGTWFVVWEDDRDGNNEIYSARVQAAFSGL